MFTSKVAVSIDRPLDEVFTYIADARTGPSGTTASRASSPNPGSAARMCQRLLPVGRRASRGSSSRWIARTTQQNLDRAYPRLKQLLETGSAA
jgi:hypothetical protein